MTLRERLAAMAAAGDPDGSVTVSIRWLRAQLEQEVAPVPASPIAQSVDLTVDQVAAAFDVAPSTVRTWLSNGQLPGAYKGARHAWRIPRGAVEAMQRAQAEAHRNRPAPEPDTELGKFADLSSWRRHVAQDRGGSVPTAVHADQRPRAPRRKHSRSPGIVADHGNGRPA